MAPCSPACAYGANSDRNQIKIKSSLYSWYYTKVCDKFAGPISAAQRLGYTAPKKRRSGGEPLATLCRFDRARI